MPVLFVAQKQPEKPIVVPTGEPDMPKGTHVEEVYEAIKEKELAAGHGKQAAQSRAARIAQAKTGKSLATGKAPKHKKR